MALKYVNSKTWCENEISIFITSITVIKAISYVRSLARQLQQITQEIMIAQNEGYILRFFWISRTSNSYLWETFLQLAKEGTVAHRCIDFGLIPSSYIGEIIRRNNYNIWNERWTNSTKGETRKYFATIEDRVKIKTNHVTSVETKFKIPSISFSTVINFTKKDKRERAVTLM
jgi:hypothetical protein